jgi:eukaryotic-like serine/threonine-protein kinase
MPAEPSTLGSYRLGARRGRGRDAVFEAVDPAGKPVLIHLLPARLGAGASIPFGAAAAALANVKHPEVVRLLDAGEEGGRFFWVAEPFAGEPLGELLRRRRLSVAEAFKLWNGVLRGLGAAHRAGVLHRNLHSGQVLVSPDLARVQVTGFELAPAPSKRDARGGATGTLATGELDLSLLAYLAPEQLDGRPADARSDLYAAGAVFYEMLTGRPPDARSGLPSHLNPEVPSEVDLLVYRCMARDPAERPASIGELHQEVERLQEVLHLRLLSEVQDLSRSTSRLLGGGRRTALIAAVVVLLALIAVVAVVLL